MRKIVGLVAVAVLAGSQAPLAAQQPAGTEPPPWAFTVPPQRAGGGGGGGGGGGTAAANPPAEQPLTLPGTTQRFTRAQLRDGFNVADWHPDTHPPMPAVVQHGRNPDVRGCGFCHYPNGQGRPENAGVAGQPREYIIQQMYDFKNGLRKSSEPRMGPPAAMLRLATAANDEEIRSAAEYFSSFPFRKWVRVVETNTVPKMRIAGGMHVPLEGEEAGTEPIGTRIIETPEDFSRTEIRDPTSGFVAYVPVGSIARGEALVKTGGNGRTVACGSCHGADMRGLGPVPAVAGRSPSYTVRQLFDLQGGARKGVWSPLMKDVVDDLTIEDMVNIAAYTASLDP